MLSQRVKAALIFVPLVLILIYLGGWPFNLFVLLVLGLAAFEYARLFSQMDYHPSFLVILVGLILFVLQRWIFHGQYLGVLLTLIILLSAIAVLIEHERGGRDSAIHFSLILAGILYLGWVGSALIPLRAMPYGRGWMLTALPSVWLADSGAYSIGRRFGKSKMTPRTSPGKTWAGYVGALVTGTISGLLLVWLWRSVDFLPPQTPLWQGAAMGFVLSALTPIGDLLISLFKRSAGVKDTGNLIPGHGGALDRIDTWIWAALLGYYLVLAFQVIG